MIATCKSKFKFAYIEEHHEEDHERSEHHEDADRQVGNPDVCLFHIVEQTSEEIQNARGQVSGGRIGCDGDHSSIEQIGAIRREFWIVQKRWVQKSRERGTQRIEEEQNLNEETWIITEQLQHPDGIHAVNHLCKG